MKSFSARGSMIADKIITIPAFAPRGGNMRHFFGTRRLSEDLRLEVGVPSLVPQVDDRAPSLWLLSVKQVHGTDALIVDRPVTVDDRFSAGWDALVTNQPGIMVAVRTADCVPVLMHDPQGNVVAAVHAGWRGTVAGIVEKTIVTMGTRFGTRPEHLRIGIGPSAGGCCYEVDSPVLDAVDHLYACAAQVVRNRRGSKGYLDLKQLIRQQALTIGVRPEAVFSVDLCTICHEALFFSYRREGRVVGTMVSAIGLLPRQETCHQTGSAANC
ncbi:MAG: peptidoglycan editing factor PgeF [Nitrospira sp.]|nr:peptidoglycan editing factor PgeF [Nitrospira sp.]